MKNLILTLIVLITAASYSNAQVNVGEEAPDFTLTSLQNQEVSLSDFEGKVVFIYMFGADCPYCKNNRDAIETNLYQEFKSNPDFAAIGMDTWDYSRSAVENFKADKITFTLLLNGKATSEDYYGAPSYDRTLVVGSDGLLKYKGDRRVSGDEITATKNAISEALENITTSNENPVNIPGTISLDQNYPNPFNPSTTINYSLDKPGRVSLKIYNILGSEVATLVNGRQPAGQKSISWDATSSSGAPLPSGIYIYRLRFADQVLTNRMTLIK